jgi:hypothetical protein
MSEQDLVWEAPPVERRASIYNDAIDQLKERAGQWARVRVTGSQSGAYSARKGFLKAANDPRFEARSGPLNGTSDYGVWARYRTREQMQAVKR